MGRYLYIYWLFLKNGLIREMMFRWNFIIRIATEVAWLAASLAFWQVMFSYTRNISGWSKYEVYLLVGTAHLIHQAFEGFFFSNLVQIPEMIRSGNMDFNLTKPLNSQFIVSTRYIDMGSLANIIIGLFISGYAISRLQIALTPFKIFSYLLLSLNGILIYYSIMFTLMTLAFWIVRVDGVVDVYFNVINFARQPADIYKGFLKTFFIFIFPMLVTINFPVMVLIRVLSSPYLVWSLLVGFISLYISNRFWKYALNHYSSASS
jgi:ABC-2 type transport system permease protein